MNPRAPSAPAVRLNGISKTYRTGEVDVPALRNIEFEIPYHRFSMVVGASGSGKSTLLNLIGCIDAPSVGTIEVCGQPVGSLGDDALADFRARNVGFIFQTFSLVPVLSAFENVEYPLVLTGTPEAERRRRTTGGPRGRGAWRVRASTAQRALRRADASGSPSRAPW